MTNDRTIEYQGKLIEVTNNIEKLETLEINTENYKLKVEEIKKETDEQVKEQYNSYDKCLLGHRIYRWNARNF